ncbi:MAG: hypothetical protein QOC80_2539, partial [Frankiaceae bacterium]|nr:hypothetical protein [Frankiaceae bacterium]
MTGHPASQPATEVHEVTDIEPRKP